MLQSIVAYVYLFLVYIVLILTLNMFSTRLSCIEGTTFGLKLNTRPLKKYVLFSTKIVCSINEIGTYYIRHVVTVM